MVMPSEVEQALQQWENNEKLSFYMFQVIFLGVQGLFFEVTNLRKSNFRTH